MQPVVGVGGSSIAGASRDRVDTAYQRHRLALRRSFSAREQLVDADRRGHVGQVVFEARRDDAIVPTAAPRTRSQASCDRPCSDIRRIRSASAASSVTAMPPSPVVIVLFA